MRTVRGEKLTGKNEPFIYNFIKSVNEKQTRDVTVNVGEEQSAWLK